MPSFAQAYELSKRGLVTPGGGGSWIPFPTHGCSLKDQHTPGQGGDERGQGPGSYLRPHRREGGQVGCRLSKCCVESTLRSMGS